MADKKGEEQKATFIDVNYCEDLKTGGGHRHNDDDECERAQPRIVATRPWSTDLNEEHTNLPSV